jgi:hypothetical protein
MTFDVLKYQSRWERSRGGLAFSFVGVQNNVQPMPLSIAAVEYNAFGKTCDCQ